VAVVESDSAFNFLMMLTSTFPLILEECSTLLMSLRIACLLFGNTETVMVVESSTIPKTYIFWHGARTHWGEEVIVMRKYGGFVDVGG
jgi:hypothetical protein